MADRLDLSIIRNEPFITTVTVVSENGEETPFDLTNYNISGGIKYKYTEDNLVDFDLIINSPPTNGTISLSLTKVQTSGLPISECIYYVKAIPSGDNSSYVDLLNGYALINPL